MARTDRNNANVESLDNIDLDDMFADDGDALFDGIDLGIDMDEIEPSTDNNRNDVASSAAVTNKSNSSSRSRRKRKTKTPAFLEDDADDYLDLEEEESQPVKKRKKKKSKTSSKKKSSQVAAAGQFGGRQAKRKSSTTAPAATNKPAPPSSSQPIPPPQPKPETILKPPQNLYCGLNPQTTMFYPFLPKLPPEPAISSRKAYALVDRIHAGFLSHLAPASSSSNANKGSNATKGPNMAAQLPKAAQTPVNPNLVKLMQEACKEPEQLENLPHAIGNTRQTIELLDRHKLANDWYNVLGLLQRQHDFLKHCSENMERWCRQNFSIDDFAEVYLDMEKGKLSNFSSQQVKINIVLNNYKDPKQTLIAVMPKSAVKIPDKTKVTEKKTAKRKSAITYSSTAASTVSTAASVASVSNRPDPKVIKAAVPPRYSNMKPVRRRKNVEVMLAQTARRLEQVQEVMLEQKIKKHKQGERELKKVIDDDNLDMNHTKGLWKYVETMGLFGSIENADIEEILGELKESIVAPKRGTKSASGLSDIQHVSASVQDRLQSLLVAEDAVMDDDDSATSMMDDDWGEIDTMAFDEVSTLEDRADLSAFSVEERAILQLHRLGLSAHLTLPLKGSVKPTPKVEAVSARTLNGTETKENGGTSSSNPSDGKSSSLNANSMLAAQQKAVTSKSETTHAEATISVQEAKPAKATDSLEQLKEDSVKASSSNPSPIVAPNVPAVPRNASQLISTMDSANTTLDKSLAQGREPVEPQQTAQTTALNAKEGIISHTGPSKSNTGGNLVPPQENSLKTKEVAGSPMSVDANFPSGNLPKSKEGSPMSVESQAIVDTASKSIGAAATADCHKPAEEVDELEGVIDNMIECLTEIDEANNARISFLETLCKSSHLSAHDMSQKQQREAALAARCQQLMRKTKEQKSKRIAKKADNMALPW